MAYTGLHQHTFFSSPDEANKCACCNSSMIPIGLYSNTIEPFDEYAIDLTRDVISVFPLSIKEDITALMKYMEKKSREFNIVQHGVFLGCRKCGNVDRLSSHCSALDKVIADSSWHNKKSLVLDDKGVITEFDAKDFHHYQSHRYAILLPCDKEYKDYMTEKERIFNKVMNETFQETLKVFTNMKEGDSVDDLISKTANILAEKFVPKED